MKELLFHVSNGIYDILEPREEDNYERCICFTKNKFISYFGKYLYIFDYNTLNNDFYIKEQYSGCLNKNIHFMEKQFIYKSKELEKEYRIYEPINVKRYCLCIAEHWNHLGGVLEEKLFDKTIRHEQVNLWNR